MNAPHQGQPYGFKRMTVEGKRRTDFEMVCATCGFMEPLHMDPYTPPEIIVKKFREKGWTVSGKRNGAAVCWWCANGKERGVKRDAKEQDPVSSSPADTKAEMPAGPTIAQLKRIADHVRGCFDAQGGHYIDNSTDHTIADALNVPWSWVRSAREVMGFVIKVDPEVKALRAELAALAEMITNLANRLEQIERKRLG
jgi:hypothetical protein